MNKIVKVILITVAFFGICAVAINFFDAVSNKKFKESMVDKEHPWGAKIFSEKDYSTLTNVISDPFPKNMNEVITTETMFTQHPSENGYKSVLGSFNPSKGDVVVVDLVSYESESYVRNYLTTDVVKTFHDQVTGKDPSIHYVRVNPKGFMDKHPMGQDLDHCVFNKWELPKEKYIKNYDANTYNKCFDHFYVPFGFKLTPANWTKAIEWDDKTEFYKGKSYNKYPVYMVYDGDKYSVYNPEFNLKRSDVVNWMLQTQANLLGFDYDPKSVTTLEGYLFGAPNELNIDLKEIDEGGVEALRALEELK